MKTGMTDFENYVMLHNFMHTDEPLKAWIDETCYDNIYSRDWESIMEVAEQLTRDGYSFRINHNNVSMHWGAENKLRIGQYDMLGNFYHVVLATLKIKLYRESLQY